MRRAEDISRFSGDTSINIWLEEVKKKLREAADAALEESGSWGAIFAKYDEDGSGEIDQDEFVAVVRGCGINEGVMPGDDLIKMFAAVDEDGSGNVDADEFEKFVNSDALAADMTFDVFVKALFELAALWVAKEDEQQYATFLESIFDNIAGANGKLRELVMNGDSFELAPLEEVVSVVEEDGTVEIEGVEVIQHLVESSSEEEGVPEPDVVDEEAERRTAEEQERLAKEEEASALAKKAQVKRTTLRAYSLGRGYGLMILLRMVTSTLNGDAQSRPHLRPTLKKRRD